MLKNERHEKFLQLLAENDGRDRVKLYYEVFPHVKKWKEKSVINACGKLMMREDCQRRYNELRKEHAKRHRVTMDHLLAELEEARQAALHPYIRPRREGEGAEHYLAYVESLRTSFKPQVAAAVAATAKKASLLGFDKGTTGDDEVGEAFDIVFRVAQAKDDVRVTRVGLDS